jgi:hypothetical protein
MEDGNYTSGLWRTKSEQLESVVEDLKSPPGSSESTGGGSGSLTRKSSKRASPGGRNTHIRKARSAQTSLKVDLDEVNSGAALSRASSLGLSFSFTGFSVPLDEISNSKPFSDDDIRKFINQLNNFLYIDIEYVINNISHSYIHFNLKVERV